MLINNFYIKLINIYQKKLILLRKNESCSIFYDNMILLVLFFAILRKYQLMQYITFNTIVVFNIQIN
jgi:hypothetical protein